MHGIGRVGRDVAGDPRPEEAVLVRLAAEGQRVIGESVDRRGHFHWAENARTRQRTYLHQLVVVAASLQIGRIEKADVDPAVSGHRGYRHERLIESA